MVRQMNRRTSLERQRGVGRPCVAVLCGLALMAGVLCQANAYAAEKLRLVEHEETNTTIHVDRNSSADAVGDVIVFANPVFDSGNLHQVGVVQGSCVRVIVGASWECSFTLVMGHDRITLEGPYADEGDSVFAITGGSGRFLSARGRMITHVREGKAGATPIADLTYEIQ